MPSWLPLLAVCTFLMLGIGMRSWLQKRRHGTWGIVLFLGDAQQKVRDGGLLLLFATLLVQALVVWHYDIDPADLDPSLPNADSWPWTGSLFAFGGIAVLVTAQLQLGASWRIGIDEQARPGLVEVGIYRWSRNPIFSGLLLFLLGYLLLVPTWISLALLVGAGVGIDRQVRAEEQWLLRTYGDDYQTYARRVGRYLPRLRHHGD